MHRGGLKEEAACEGDELTGVRILARALTAPARQIAENSAADGGVVVARMMEGKGDYGFDAARNEYVILSRRVSSIRPKLFALHLKMRSRSQVCSASAQKAKGVVLCLAACSKSDKGCQDRCVPAGVGSKGSACIEKCRRRASEPDLVAKMTRCVNVCLGEAATR